MSSDAKKAANVEMAAKAEAHFWYADPAVKMGRFYDLKCTALVGGCVCPFQLHMLQHILSCFSGLPHNPSNGLAVDALSVRMRENPMEGIMILPQIRNMKRPLHQPFIKSCR